MQEQHLPTSEAQPTAPLAATPTPAPQPLTAPAAASAPAPMMQQQPPHHKSVAIYIVGFVLALLIILLSSSAALAYAVTYQRFSIGHPDIEMAISQQVQSLPFTPKTSTFLLESMVASQKKVSKHSFDVSLASGSNTIASSLGLTSFDVQVKGDVDYSDIKNVKTSLDASVSNQYNFQLRKKDALVYFKADKIPQAIFLVLGITPDQAETLMTQWISVDTTPLNTDARKYLDQNTTTTPTSQKTIENIKEILSNPAILAKITQSQEDVNGHPSYKLSFKADPVTIDYLGKQLEQAAQESAPSSLLYTRPTEEKLSDTVKSLNIDIWIDKDSYYMRKVVSAVTVLPPNRATSAYVTPGSDTSKKGDPISFALALTLDKFGEAVNVETPDKSVTFDDLMKQLSAIKSQGQ